MAVTPVLRALNDFMVPKIRTTAIPGFVAEIGNAAQSKPGANRLIWRFLGGPQLGAIQVSDAAKVLGVRQVTLIAEIRVKVATVGIGEKDYELAEEVIRRLYQALDALCSADWEMGNEDWSGTSTEPDGACVVVRVPISLRVKVLDDPWQRVIPDQAPDALGSLDDSNNIG